MSLFRTEGSLASALLRAEEEPQTTMGGTDCYANTQGTLLNLHRYLCPSIVFPAPTANTNAKSQSIYLYSLTQPQCNQRTNPKRSLRKKPPTASLVTTAATGNKSPPARHTIQSSTPPFQTRAPPTPDPFQTPPLHLEVHTILPQNVHPPPTSHFPPRLTQQRKPSVFIIHSKPM